MLDYIMDNYIWFIVIGVVLVMALIGYIADKTDFGRNRVEKEKKVKKVKENIKPEKIEVDAKGISELTDEVSKKDSILPKQDTEENATKQLDEVKIEEPKQVANEDLYAPLGDDKVEDNMNNTIDSSLYAPLTSNENKVENDLANGDNLQKNDAVTEADKITDIPDKEELENKQEPTNVESEEDIWKF